MNQIIKFIIANTSITFGISLLLFFVSLVHYTFNPRPSTEALVILSVSGGVTLGNLVNTSIIGYRMFQTMNDKEEE